MLPPAPRDRTRDRTLHRLFHCALVVAATAACGTVSDGGTPDGGADLGATEYAPYFYSWAWGNPAYAFTSLVDMKASGGPAAVTLAFVTSSGGCRASTDIAAQRDDLRAYVAAGGHLKAGFGGATGTYLEAACATAGELAAAIGQFVDDTGITDLDFDLEQGAASSNPAINQRRAQALAQLQRDKHVRVSFTFPVAPGGLLQDSLDILQAAITAGVDISIVNGMTMDYGNGTDLGTTPSRSVDAIAIQLRGLIPGLTLEQAYRRTGATAMIGKNDDDEIFTLDNARTLVAHARAKRLGLLSFWAIHRDQRCSAANDIALCSRLNTSPFEFHAIFDGVTAAR